MKLVKALRRAGVLGINGRNASYTLRWNPRKYYPTVDDKLETKRLCEAAGIPVPRLFAVARHHFELRDLPARLGDESSFVLKPAHGAMGNGILVIRERRGNRLQRPPDRWIEMDDLLYHAASIISGLYALGGQPDVAMVEERLVIDPRLGEIAKDGVPDVRVIVYRGIPVMAMTRLPTRRSGGRANIHQGAVAAGIDLQSGRLVHAISAGQEVDTHPDTGLSLLDRSIPEFSRVVDIAVRATDQTRLGYVGADVVVDARHGPMILELNARPGLTVQLANRAGLLPRLLAVDRVWKPNLPVSERLAMGLEVADRRALDTGA